MAIDQFREASYAALAEAYTELGDPASAPRILDLAAGILGDLGDTRLQAGR